MFGGSDKTDLEAPCQVQLISKPAGSVLPQRITADPTGT